MNTNSLSKIKADYLYVLKKQQWIIDSVCWWAFGLVFSNILEKEVISLSKSWENKNGWSYVTQKIHSFEENKDINGPESDRNTYTYFCYFHSFVKTKTSLQLGKPSKAFQKEKVFLPFLMTHWIIEIF